MLKQLALVSKLSYYFCIITLPYLVPLRLYYRSDVTASVPESIPPPPPAAPLLVVFLKFVRVLLSLFYYLEHFEVSGRSRGSSHYFSS